MNLCVHTQKAEVDTQPEPTRLGLVLGSENPEREENKYYYYTPLCCISLFLWINAQQVQQTVWQHRP